ncbi:MAG: ADP-forming succinate--CoA ligase subunit beta [Bacteroidales bacterium]|nr:ADP-forming succinate--CoA ligase subunit beta [Bacteroidales bacterium]MCF8344517.1 ADP-forming succinate--CoA ligase subunit beta [Bacteroidales bacterium]MCF8350773.1 ADP-forming succinate--CoA ligase subunit beta [Bacteroidales bacterium]MCF8376860.1 ADP-forming succinate--CoA ligase subunit beta [Bacteroidales bacterium]MCF8401875.1 ADP-forming succinate--CoA ligase subunit beta [Bacteroidales bacterium]
MNLHEYQGKSILSRYGASVATGYPADTAEQAVEAAKTIQDETGSKFFVVKAQIHAGGRGKGGGVKLAKSLDEVRDLSKQILGMNLVTRQTGKEGKLVRKVLIQQDVYYDGPSEVQEFYVGILLNRQTGRNMIMYSPRGGVDIEAVAEETPEQIFYEEIDPSVGFQGYQGRKVAYNLGLNGKAFKEMVKFVAALYKAYEGADAKLFEINPVIKASDDRIYAVDCKVSIDDNAMFRHPDIVEMRDVHEEDPIELEASKYDLSYVKMDGNVGCMVNGAGLAMATMDIIKLSGGEPANFLDVGGTADAKRVEEAFRIILKDENVEAILINIFGGIVRCDRVAQGVVDAYKNIGKIDQPVIVRLQGTNAEEGKKIIDESGLKVHSAIRLEDAATLVGKVL